MRIKQLVLIVLIFCFSSPTWAGDGRFYIYGKCTLVEDQELEGFITIKKDKLWVAQFISTKLENPYAKLFPNDGSIRFGESRDNKPAVHSFICRYNDISQLRPVSKNRLEVTIKNNNAIDVEYKFENPISIQLSDGTSRSIEWRDIASINFMPSPDITPMNSADLYIGSVESTHGVYLGIIEGLNYANQVIPIEITHDSNIDLRVSDIDEIKCRKNWHIDITVGNTTLRGENIKIKRDIISVRVYMPTMGSVDIPWDKIKTIKKYSKNNINQATYNSSIPPKLLSGSVKINYKESFITPSLDGKELDVEYKYATHTGPIAYDLDESLNIEFIEGQNDGLFYRLMLNCIKSIEPRNYNYSLIYLNNGSRISLGSEQDVSFKNNGVLMLDTKTFVPWRYISFINFSD